MSAAYFFADPAAAAAGELATLFFIPTAGFFGILNPAGADPFFAPSNLLESLGPLMARRRQARSSV